VTKRFRVVVQGVNEQPFPQCIVACHPMLFLLGTHSRFPFISVDHPNVLFSGYMHCVYGRAWKYGKLSQPSNQIASIGESGRRIYIYPQLNSFLAFSIVIYSYTFTLN
jgi:hypothetical protein